MPFNIERARAGLAVAAAIGLMASEQTASAGNAVPFMATFSGDAWFASETTVIFDGSGQASHLGRTKNDGFLAPLIPEPTDECEAGWGLYHINTETLTAANGDRLVLEMNDLACPVGPGVFRGTGHWTVISGTGRFAAATGSGTVVGGGDFNVGRFAIMMTGEIAY